MSVYEEMRADAILLTDEDAIRKASNLGAKPITLADVGSEAHQTGVLNPRQLLEYANQFLEQGILVTGYMEKLRDEAKLWQSKQT